MDKTTPELVYDGKDSIFLTKALIRLGLLEKGKNIPAPSGKTTGVAGKSRVYFLVLLIDGDNQCFVAKFDEPKRAKKEWGVIEDLRKRNAQIKAMLPLHNNNSKDGVVIYPYAPEATYSGFTPDLKGLIRKQMQSASGNCATAINMVFEALGLFYNSEPGKLTLSDNNGTLTWEKAYPKLIGRLTGIRKTAEQAWPEVDWNADRITGLLEDERVFPNPIRDAEKYVKSLTGKIMQSRIHGDLNLTNILVNLDATHTPKSIFLIDLASSRSGAPTAVDYALLESEFWQEALTECADEHSFPKNIQTFVDIRDFLEGRKNKPGMLSSPLLTGCLNIVKNIRNNAIFTLGAHQPEYCLGDYLTALYFSHLFSMSYPSVKENKSKQQVALLGASLSLQFILDLEKGNYSNKKYVSPVKCVKKSRGALDRQQLVIPDAYKKWIKLNCGTMDIDTLREKGTVIQVSLPEMFIQLYAYPTDKNSKKSPKQQNMGLTDWRETPEEIESLIFKYPHLLVEGQAGSGKTTLMKHFCITNLEKDNPLPILIFLKDLQPIEDEFKKRRGSAADFEEMLTRYFEITENGLDIALVKSFCRAKDAMIILDGLDEIGNPFRDFMAKALADFRNNNCAPRVILSGRPNGLQGSVIDYFGNLHLRILPLNTAQVEKFVRKWFGFIQNLNEPDAIRTTADDMLAAMRSHPDVNDLKDTPLMLTAICMLYYDNKKELPGQRVELYDMFITFLLKKKFGASLEERHFLMDLALAMHHEKTRKYDRISAVGLLGKRILRKDNETQEKYNSFLENEFDRIESQCGLLKLESGGYTFWHLSFQAFLAATDLLRLESSSFFDAIKPFWSDEWHQEMIALYIGSLSQKSSGMANGIVLRVMNEIDQEPYDRWRLAAKALCDIHKDSRDKEVVVKTVEKLQEIMGSEAGPKVRADAGEILGRLGEPRSVEVFVGVKAGSYPLSSGIKKVKAFEICKYPVTNSWYRRFVNSKGYSIPEYWTPEGHIWLQKTQFTEPAFWYDRQWNCPNSPVVGVSWYEAHAFTQWLNQTRKDGYRYFLPDENQWEAAAAGKEKRKYPWGNDWQEDCCNSEESNIQKTSPVGLFANGNTPEGISDLAGNVWEWTRSNYNTKKSLNDFRFDEELYQLWENYLQSSENERKERSKQYFNKLEEKVRELSVVRGGAWYDDRDFVRCAYRFRSYPFGRDINLGFRCARTKI